MKESRQIENFHDFFYSRGLPDGRNSFKHFTRIGTRSERRAIERNH